MFGTAQFGTHQYARVGLETGVVAASPHQLILMLYDGAISACIMAIPHMRNRDFEKKGALITKAIMIIESGLRLSLDKKVGGEIALSLDALYAYMGDRLFVANRKNEIEPVEEVVRLLKELKSAWEAIGETEAAKRGR